MTVHNPTDTPAALNAVDSGSETELPKAESTEKTRDADSKPPHRGVRGPRSLRRSRSGDRSPEGTTEASKPSVANREGRQQNSKITKSLIAILRTLGTVHAMRMPIVKGRVSPILVLLQPILMPFLVL